MDRGVGMLYARTLAMHAPEERRFRGRVDESGHMDAEVVVDAHDMHLIPGRPNRVRAVIFEPTTVGLGKPRPVRRPLTGRAMTCELTLTPKTSRDIICAHLASRVYGYEGQWVDIVVGRVHEEAKWLLAAGVVALVVAGGCALLSWGDPAARRGHYEGKTPEEIQRDLDEDVAWYAMEISVASKIVCPEGQTKVEARLENPVSNHCDQKVKVWETGHEDDVLFESGAIAPGEYLQTIELAHPLPAGTHTLTFSFQGYERTPAILSDEGMLLGHDTFGARCAAEVTLEVTPAVV